MSLVRAQRFTLVTALAPEECVARLVAATDPETGLGLLPVDVPGSKRVIARVSGSWVRLRRRPRIDNPFQPLLDATIRPGSPVAVVECRVAASVGIRLRIAALYGFMAVVLLAAVAVAVAGPEHGRASVWQGVFAFSVVILFCTSLLWFLSQYLVRGEAASLKKFVTETLEASPHGPTSGRKPWLRDPPTYEAGDSSPPKDVP